MRPGAFAITAAALALAGCGGSGGDGTTTAPSRTTTSVPEAIGELPAGPVAPAQTSEQSGEGPAASEASPEAPAAGPSSSGGLPDADRADVAASVTTYIAALDRHDAARVCALLAPGSLDLSELPARRGGCRPSLHASIGVRPRGGGPAWRQTRLVETRVERLGEDRARVSATVTHHFSDRKYVSVEDDVIYLERAGDHWLLAKPSGTLYRAVGYAEPPLRALSPPSGW
jgi:hypothetical protein